MLLNIKEGHRSSLTFSTSLNGCREKTQRDEDQCDEHHRVNDPLTLRPTFIHHSRPPPPPPPLLHSSTLSFFLSLSRNTPLNRQQCWISKRGGGWCSRTKTIESICRHDGRFVASASALLLTAGYRGCSGIFQGSKEWKEMFYCSWATEGNQTYRRFVINKRIYNSPTGKVYGVKMNPDPLYTWGKLSLTCFRITEIKKSRPVFSLSLTLQANQLFGLFLPVKILNRLLTWSVIYLGWFLPGTLSDMHNFTFIMWRTSCHA